MPDATTSTVHCLGETERLCIVSIQVVREGWRESLAHTVDKTVVRTDTRRGGMLMGIGTNTDIIMMRTLRGVRIEVRRYRI
ncbi:hypothetical protein [Prevotella corporis]|uniref:hypothetical protein n=1 Tax=Prevotella corporis TaxID=28128 RepID=UPI0023F05EF7|nr:hypothetical protein [Prevotella corporis]